MIDALLKGIQTENVIICQNIAEFANDSLRTLYGFYHVTNKNVKKTIKTPLIINIDEIIKET